MISNDRSGKIQLTDFLSTESPDSESRGVPEMVCCRNSVASFETAVGNNVRTYKTGSATGYITPEELVRIIIPLSGAKAELRDYVDFILRYRAGEITLMGWSDCTEGANDFRIAREYLLFLSNYGYLCKSDARKREEYHVNKNIFAEIEEIIHEQPKDESLLKALDQIRASEVILEVERKRIQTRGVRPNQAVFRKDVLKACEKCVITNVMMPEILEAAHIKPFKYNGKDTIANGYTLFDAGHLRISPEGDIELSNRARLDYGASIPPRIVIPPFTNREFLRWRWENYNGF